MTAKRLTEETIFTEALEKSSPDECAAFLDSACRIDAGLRARVENLLRSHREAPNFLEGPDPHASDSPKAERPGSTIDRYKLLEQIGEGGFGIVFMAEQTEPVRRTVAIKVLKPGMDSRQVIARFEAERQALAIMDHPNIARVFDAGQTKSGRPHFVMELVRGVPITHYCDQNKLTMRSRLALFGTVCEAIQHAHHKGIIHRDIKPTNVLVTLHDGVPVVKVIDFGIAKAIGKSLTDKTLWTGFAQMIGTPTYMSPEQAEMSGLDIDMRTDVYSLGVLLYELLTGTTPFDEERIRAVGYDELRRIILEEEPLRPSARISTMGHGALTLATQRQIDPKRLPLLLRGELDWIVMKALEKDRRRRYESASALHQDVKNYLADEAVVACPPSAAYRFRKLARRNRRALTITIILAAALGVVVAVTAGSIGWVVRGETARNAALDLEVDHALDDVVTRIEKEDWPEAEASMHRAEKLLRAAGRSQLPPRLTELQKDLAMVQRLEEILERIRMVATPSFGMPRPTRQERPTFDDLFATSFRDYGIDLITLTSGEAAERIRPRPIRVELARALDFWCRARRTDQHLPAQDWKELFELAKAVDPDPVRCGIREAGRRKDRAALETLAASPDVQLLPPESLLLLGLALFENSTIEQTLCLMRKGQLQFPGNLWINDLLGWFCMHRSPDLLNEAIQCYSANLALRPDHWQSWCKRGFAFEKLRQPDKALVNVSRALELNPQSPSLWQQRGRVRGDLGQWQQMLEDFARAIDLGSNDSDAFRYRGVAYSNLEQWDKAIVEYSRAIELKPRDSLAFAQRGTASAVLGHWGDAANDLDRAVQLHPVDVLKWKASAIYRLQAGDSDGYRRICTEMLQRFGQSKDPFIAEHVTVSWILMPQPVEDRKLLIELTARALAGAPRDPWRVLTRASACYRVGQYEQVVQQLEAQDSKWAASAAKEGGPVVAWLFLAMAHHHLGHATLARSWLDKTIQRMSQETAVPVPGPLRRRTHEWAICLVLRREAETLLAQDVND